VALAGCLAFARNGSLAFREVKTLTAEENYSKQGSAYANANSIYLQQ